MNRNCSKRINSKKPSYDLTSIDRQTFNPKRDSIPITSIAAIHYAKRQTCPNIHFINDFNNLPPQDQSTVAQNSIKGVYDSRKLKNQCMSKLDWKILTLKEIKGMRNPMIQQQPKIQESQHKSKQKIFVSISKSNRSSVSKQNKANLSPKLSQLGGQLTLLNSISNKRKIVDMVELQMEEGIRTNRFFCN